MNTVSDILMDMDRSSLANNMIEDYFMYVLYILPIKDIIGKILS